MATCRRVEEPDAKDYDFADLSPALVKAATFDGQLTGIPLNIEGPVLYYRTDMFKKCGVENPRRIADIEPSPQKIKACDADGHAVRLARPEAGGAFTYSVLHNIGGSYVKDGKSQPVLAGGPGLARTCSRVAARLRPARRRQLQLPADLGALQGSQGGDVVRVLERAADGDGRRCATQGHRHRRAPAGPGGLVPYRHRLGMSVSNFSKHKEAAWYFVQWATSPEVQKRMAVQGIAPPRPAVANDPDYRKWIDEQPVRKEWQAALDVLATKGSSEVGYPIVANPQSREFIGQAVQDLILKQKTLDQACADADKGLDELIAQKIAGRWWTPPTL